MDLKQAESIAYNFILDNSFEFRVVEICGSIRRKKANVNDIDLVAIPKNPETFLKKFDANIRGPKRVEIFFSGIKIDIYIADEKNFEVLKLIRTGSAEHNIKLCKEAIKRGWKLKANGDGLITPSGAIRTEKGILEALLGKYVEPEDRL